jgi:hypothetical protein
LEEIMSENDEKSHSRRMLARVREILMQEWDPIGIKDVVRAQDEYDPYVGKVSALVADSQQSREDIAAYLLSMESEQMGLAASASARERCMHTAEKLIVEFR